MRINICIDIGPTPSAQPSILDELAKIVGGVTVGYKGAQWLSPALSSILDAFKTKAAAMPKCEARMQMDGGLMNVYTCILPHGHDGDHLDDAVGEWRSGPPSPSTSQA